MVKRKKKGINGLTRMVTINYSTEGAVQISLSLSVEGGGGGQGGGGGRRARGGGGMRALGLLSPSARGGGLAVR